MSGPPIDGHQNMDESPPQVREMNITGFMNALGIHKERKGDGANFFNRLILFDNLEPV